MKARGRPSGRPGQKAYHHGDLRNVLLHAARRRLEQGGLEALSLRGLAKSAGVSHAAPAHHFTDRQGLIAALVGLGYRELAAAMRQAIEATSTPRRALDAIGVAYVRFAVEHPQLFRLMFQEASQLAAADAEAVRAAEDCRRILGDTVSDVVASRPEPTGAGLSPSALMAWAGVHGLATLWIDGQLRSLFPGRGGKAAFLEAVQALFCGA